MIADWLFAGNALAMRNLGGCYENGTGVDKNQVKAAELYQRGADLGELCLMHVLSDILSAPEYVESECVCFELVLSRKFSWCLW